MRNIARLQTTPSLHLVEPESEIDRLKQELAELRSRVPPTKETGQQIAARIRSGMGPTRPIVQRCLERTYNPETERFI